MNVLLYLETGLASPGESAVRLAMIERETPAERANGVTDEHLHNISKMLLLMVESYCENNQIKLTKTIGTFAETTGGQDDTSY